MTPRRLLRAPTGALPIRRTTNFPDTLVPTSVFPLIPAILRLQSTVRSLPRVVATGPNRLLRTLKLRAPTIPAPFRVPPSAMAPAISPPPRRQATASPLFGCPVHSTLRSLVTPAIPPLLIEATILFLLRLVLVVVLLLLIRVIQTFLPALRLILLFPVPRELTHRRILRLRTLSSVCRMALQAPRLLIIPPTTAAGTVNLQLVQEFAREQSTVPTFMSLLSAPINVFFEPLVPTVVLARTKSLMLPVFNDCVPVEMTLVAIAEARPKGPFMVSIYLFIPSPLELLTGSAGRLPVLIPTRVRLAAPLALTTCVANLWPLPSAMASLLVFLIIRPPAMTHLLSSTTIFDLVFPCLGARIRRPPEPL